MIDWHGESALEKAVRPQRVTETQDENPSFQITKGRNDLPTMPALWSELLERDAIDRSRHVLTEVGRAHVPRRRSLGSCSYMQTNSHGT